MFSQKELFILMETMNTLLISPSYSRFPLEALGHLDSLTVWQPNEQRACSKFEALLMD